MLLLFRLTILFKELVEQNIGVHSIIAVIRIGAAGLPTKCQVKGARPYIGNCLRDSH